ncbi:Oidioi.mRNA.OKI2018_I69.XSR.g16995.t1.cds [Oikopleura dioica]|uniref:Oidioi.mRNA.OKI2018_I69.XSR.g16995.t1.cds n=1 Tax=Oikopleura dioica TaxID=34765 RepID=A0ABN7SIC9_OIKDI|nr:Oidioi.mRNA.OKI2018_I69.XSR.g16995.t1.cds [Oikopleura dioica]
MFLQIDLIMALQRQQLINNLIALHQAMLVRNGPSASPALELQRNSTTSTFPSNFSSSESSSASEASEVPTSEYFSDSSSSSAASEMTSGAISSTTGLTHAKAAKGSASSKSCSFCPATFKSNTDLARHERIHTGEKPFECSICHRRFNRKGNMEKHMGTHYKGAEKLKFMQHRVLLKPFSCACGKNFRSRGFYERHQERCALELQNIKPETEQLIDVENDFE